MTNEELCKLYQTGDAEKLNPLWLQCEPFIRMMAGKYQERYFPDKQSLVDDAVNESFFIFKRCAETFDFTMGFTFLTFLSASLKNPFRTVMMGGRGARKERDPINQAFSLDVEAYKADGDESPTLGETIPDDSAGDDYNAIDDESFWRDVHTFIESGLGSTPETDGRKIRQYMLANDVTFKEAVIDLYGVDAYQSNSRRTKLWHDTKRTDSGFKAYCVEHKDEIDRIGMTDYIFRNSMQCYGLSAFRHSFTSGVERVALDQLYLEGLTDDADT